MDRIASQVPLQHQVPPLGAPILSLVTAIQALAPASILQQNNGSGPDGFP